jgi:hypothetical protein
MSIKDVVYRVVHGYPGGVPAMAARMRISKHVLQNKVNPNNVTHHTTEEELEEIQMYADSDEIAKEFASQRSMVCIHIAKHQGASDKELFDLIINMEREKSDWLSSIQKALADGVIDPTEFKRIKKESMDHLSAVAEFASRIESIVQERRRQPRNGKKQRK